MVRSVVRQIGVVDFDLRPSSHRPDGKSAEKVEWPRIERADGQNPLFISHSLKREKLIFTEKPLKRVLYQK